MANTEKKYYVLDATELQPFDIIMEKGDDLRWSELHNLRYGTPYVHAKLYIGAGSYADINGTVVKFHQVMRTLYRQKDEAVVLRYTTGLSPQEAYKIETFARSEFGKEFHVPKRVNPYEKSEDTNEQNREYCVRLVARSYAEAGIQIVDNVDYCAPKDFFNNPLLKNTGIELREATDGEIAYAQSECVINEQDERIYGLLYKVREITKEDIQTEEQLVNFLLEHPEFDEHIYDAIKDDPYFAMIEQFRKDHPEDYDAHLWIEKYKEHALETAIGMNYVAGKNKEDPYMTQYKRYEMLQCNHTNIKTFTLFFDLYKQLLEECDIRMGLLGHVVLQLNKH